MKPRRRRCDSRRSGSRSPTWCHRPLSRSEAVALELEVEGEVLVPDLDVVELLRAANDAGVPVSAVSETYFSPIAAQGVAPAAAPV